MLLFVGVDVDCVLRSWAFFAGTEEFHARSLKLEEPGSCFHVKLGFSVHQNAIFTSIDDAMRSAALIYVRRKIPLLGQFVCLPLDFLTHKMPTQHWCAAQKPNKATQANSLSMIRNLKSRNKLTRLTKAADSDCAKNKLSLKEFSTKRKWHMNLKYNKQTWFNQADSFHKQITKTKSVLLDQVKWLGFCTFHLGSCNFHFDYRVILEVAKPELLTQFISSSWKRQFFRCSKQASRNVWYLHTEERD